MPATKWVDSEITFSVAGTIMNNMHNEHRPYGPGFREDPSGKNSKKESWKQLPRIEVNKRKKAR